MPSMNAAVAQSMSIRLPEPIIDTVSPSLGKTKTYRLWRKAVKNNRSRSIPANDSEPEIIIKSPFLRLTASAVTESASPPASAAVAESSSAHITAYPAGTGYSDSNDRKNILKSSERLVPSSLMVITSRPITGSKAHAANPAAVTAASIIVNCSRSHLSLSTHYPKR